MISHVWPLQYQPLLSGLVEREGQANCWFVDVDLSDVQIKELNVFEGSSRHGQVCFTLPNGQAVIGKMNSLLGLGSPADPARHTDVFASAFTSSPRDGGWIADALTSIPSLVSLGPPF